MTISASLARIRSIAAVPLQRRRSQGGLRSLWFTIAFAMSVPVLLLVIGIHSQEGRLVGAGALVAMASVLLLGAWVMFYGNLHEQAALDAVRMVPGFERHLHFTLALGVVAVCAIEAVACGLAFGQGLNAAIVTLVVLTLLTTASNWPWLACAILVAALVGSPVAFGESTLPQMLMAFAAHRDVAGPIAVALCIGLLASVAPSVRRPARAPRTSARRDAAEVAASRARREVGGRWGDPKAPGTIVIQGWWRGGRLPPRDADPLQRALSGLPLDLHLTFGWHAQWRHWLAPFALTALMAVDALKHQFGAIFLLVAGLGLMLMASDVLGIRFALRESRREQALISMLPGVPTGARLGRGLAMRLTAMHAMSLVRGVVALALIRVAMLGTGAPLDWFESPAALAALPLACVPMAALFWTNWAHAAALRASVFKMMVVPVLLVGFAMLAPHLGWASLGAVAVLYSVPTILWCAWRWHRLAAEPTVLPAGRLGA